MEKKKGKEGEWKHGKGFSKQLLKQKRMDPKFKLFSIPKIIQMHLEIGRASCRERV